MGHQVRVFGFSQERIQELKPQQRENRVIKRDTHLAIHRQRMVHLRRQDHPEVRGWLVFRNWAILQASEWESYSNYFEGAENSRNWPLPLLAFNGQSWNCHCTCGFVIQLMCYIVSLVAEIVKNMPAMQEICFQSLSQEDPLEKGMATHSCILAWRVPWKRGSWKATVRGFTKESDATEVTKHTQIRLFIPLLNFLNYFIFLFSGCFNFFPYSQHFKILELILW